MAANAFPEFKYNSGIRTPGGPLMLIAVALAIGIAIAGAAYSPFFFALMIVPAAMIIIRSFRPSPNVIVVGARYCVVGPAVVYYQNLTAARVDPEGRVLTLKSGDGRTVEIRADRFPTNAQKPDKIALNRKAKFDKVAQKVMARVKERAPSVAK